MSIRTRIFRLSSILALCGLSASASAAETSVAAPVQVLPIHAFKPGSTESRFGRLEFVGGLEFTSREPLLGSLSGIRFRADGVHFISVLDTGHWLTGEIERDAQGRLANLRDLTISPMRDASGETPRWKGAIDAESLALRRGQVLVSFERLHRVDVYPDPGFEAAKPVDGLNILIPRDELRGNGSLETVVVSPDTSLLQGGALTIAEKSVDENGNLYAAILDGPLKGQFKVRKNDPWDVTDGAFLANGDLLLLERRFNVLSGVGMRIRRIDAATIKPGAIIDGPVQIEADGSFQIDNMEGMDIVAGADGSPHIILVSDDNHSILQRNLMLEFRLID